MTDGRPAGGWTRQDCPPHKAWRDPGTEITSDIGLKPVSTPGFENTAVTVWVQPAKRSMIDT
jgi:hypothetical protein